MTPNHHLPGEILLDYAAGGMAEPMALVVATHLTLCPECRAAVGRLEAVGGALLDRLEPTPVAEGGLEAVLARLDEPAPPVRTAGVDHRPGHRLGDLMLPEPLRSYLARDLLTRGDDLKALPWHRLARGIEEHEIALGDAAARTALIKAKGGSALPWHTHGGLELTLVLSGGFADGARHFGRGDIDVADAGINHRPVADPGEDCLCLAYAEAKPRLTGPLAWIWSWFVR